MVTFPYPAGVKTISAIRLENYTRLINDLSLKLAMELGREPRDKELATALGITPAYVSQIKTGERKNIQDEAARKIERALMLEPGWMDNDPDLWPFRTIAFERFNRLPERVKGMAEQEVRRIIEEWEQSLGGVREA